MSVPPRTVMETDTNVCPTGAEREMIDKADEACLPYPFENVTAESRLESIGNGGPKGAGCVVCRHRGRRSSQKLRGTFKP